MLNGHLILTGEIGSGKSTLLLKKLNKWISDGLKIAGWITPSHFSNNVKDGYDMMIFSDSKLIRTMTFIRDKKFPKSFKWKRWWISQDAFDTIACFDFGKADQFVIDEVGPLELEDKKGCRAQLPLIYSRYKNTITVVRQSCLDLFRAEFGPMQSVSLS